MRRNHTTHAPIDQNAPLVLAYDMKARKVGCVLMQAALGCVSGPCHWWDTKCWETDNPAGLRLIRGTRSQWQRLAEMDNQRVWSKKCKEIRAALASK